MASQRTSYSASMRKAKGHERSMERAVSDESYARAIEIYDAAAREGHVTHRMQQLYRVAHQEQAKVDRRARLADRQRLEEERMARVAAQRRETERRQMLAQASHEASVAAETIGDSVQRSTTDVFIRIAATLPVRDVTRLLEAE